MVYVPQFVLDFVFRQMAPSFMTDLRRGASKALDPESPWAKRIEEDRNGFYRLMRELEAVARKRRAVNHKSIPGADVFDRAWRLRPTPQDTWPPPLSRSYSGNASGRFSIPRSASLRSFP